MAPTDNNWALLAADEDSTHLPKNKWTSSHHWANDSEQRQDNLPTVTSPNTHPQANLRKNISTSKYIWIYLDILIYPPQSKHPNNISINSQNIQISILCIMDIQIINNLSVEGVWRTDHIMCRTTHNYRRSTNNNIISYYYLLFPLDRRRRRRRHYFHS